MWTRLQVVRLINISTNGYAYTGAQKMSAGFIISGTEDVKVYIKAEKSQEAGITPLTNPKVTDLEHFQNFHAL